MIDYKVNDVLIVKQNHSCKKSNGWKILRIGSDVKLKCCGCGKRITISRQEFDYSFLRDVYEIRKNGGNIINVGETYEKEYEELRVGDRVQLNLQKFGISKWEILEINEDSVVILDLMKNRKGKMYKDKFLYAFMKNTTKTNRDKKEKDRAKKELRNYQILKFGKILMCHNLVLMKEGNECPICKNNRYRIEKISNKKDDSVLLLCDVCRETVNKIWNEEELESYNGGPLEGYTMSGYTPKYDCICPNCGAEAIAVKNEWRGTFEVVCSKCSESISKELSKTEFFDAIETADEEQILHSKNPSFIPYDEEIRVVKTTKRYRNTNHIINNKNVCLDLQIIDSANNHVTQGHRIKNKTIEIAYHKEYEIGTFEYKCHHCVDCNKTFDFYNSFKKQLEMANISPDRLCIRLRGLDHYNGYTDDCLRFENYNHESVLHSFGYIVGEYGLDKSDREKLLGYLLNKKVMTISEIKSTINSNINLFSGRPEYRLAVNQWREDLIYLNNQIEDEVIIETF